MEIQELATTTPQTACLECFVNEGLRQSLSQYASTALGSCPRCGTHCRLLDAEAIAEGMQDFFVSGSYVAETIAPVYQMNSLNTEPALFDPTLEADATLASELTKQVIFHYGPPLWRFGETEHKHAFDSGGTERTEAARAFVAAVPRLNLPSGTRLFRLRRNVDADETIVLAGSFDPPPPDPGRTPGRFDYGGAPVLYAADDIELCLHECRVTLADEIVVATLISTEPLELLDLSAFIESDGGTPFEDPNIFAAFLSRSRDEQWLGYARTVAEAARAAGLAGIRYPSYYAQVLSVRCELLSTWHGYRLEGHGVIP